LEGPRAARWILKVRRYPLFLGVYLIPPVPIFRVPDTVRGITNENGFAAIRAGLHLPGVDTSAWNSSSPIADGVPGAGILFYRTEVPLDIPKGYDVLMSLKFADEEGNWRAEAWVNGWQVVSLKPGFHKVMSIDVGNLYRLGDSPTEGMTTSIDPKKAWSNFILGPQTPN